jgi:diguanylate cyclase (GGDEF)-like protein
MFRKEPAELRATLEQLEHAERDHEAWRDGLIRSLVCRLPHDGVDLRPDSHHHCSFGRWYYEEAADELRERPSFASMEAPHRAAHVIAARLLAQSANGTATVREDYDDLVASCGRLHESLNLLREEIKAALGRRDPLTGAHGRVELLPELDGWRELARRSVESTCIVFMDVDHLKEINDRHGHAVGDRVLAGTVHFVGEHLRPYDKVFRYGGDEFVVSLPGTSLPDAMHLVDRIRAGLSRVALVTTAAGDDIRATASFGVAPLDGDDPIEQSIDRADKALLQAKAAGRDRVVGWEPSITTGTQLDWNRA